MKKLLLTSLLCTSSVFGYTELENKLFDAINNRDAQWAKELVAKLEPLSKDLKEAVTNVAEKSLKKYFKATTNMGHSYGDQWIDSFGKTGITFGFLGFMGSLILATANLEAGAIGGAVSAGLIALGITARVKAAYCVWAYRNLKQAQSVVGVIADAKVKEDEENKHEKHD